MPVSEKVEGNLEASLRNFSKKTSGTRKIVRQRKDGFLSRGKKRKKEAQENRKKNNKRNRD